MTPPAPKARPVSSYDQVRPPSFCFFLLFITLGLELSDTKVYEP